LFQSAAATLKLGWLVAEGDILLVSSVTWANRFL
jgi:hypothetical protein